MKIAIAAEGTRGDVHPMLELALQLRAEGCQVRLCAPPDFRETIEARGFEFVSIGQSVRAFLDEAAAALHTRGPKFFRETHRFGQASIESQFDILPEVTADVDLVVAAGTVLGASSAAELHGLPFRYVAYTPAMLPSREYTPAFFPFQTQPRWINGLLWRGANRAMNLAARGPVNRGRRTLGLPPLRNVVPHVMSARPIVAADAPLAPVPADCGMPCDQIPCLHPTSGDPLPSKLESFLEQGPAPIFLGFGSMTDPAPERTTDRLLEAISRRGCRALISRGWAGLGNAALPEGVLAIDPVSHARLFPRVAAVIHHGGAGTTHTAARAGVPQIIVPHILDQFYFARRVENLGIAPPSLPRTQLTVPDLVERIDFVLDNELLSDAAHHLGAQLARLNHVRLDPERLAESAPLDSPA